MLTGSPWWPSGVGYLYWLFTGNIIDYQIYVLIGTLGIGIAFLAWLDIYMSTMHPEKRNLVLGCFLIFSIIFYIYLIYFLFFDPRAPVHYMIGIKRNPLDIDYKGFILIYMAVSIIVGTSTGIHFSIYSLKRRENPEVRWKGRFLLISFILFAIGAIGDGLIELNPITLITIRVILVISNILYYIGFIMPNWVKNILSLESNQ